MSKTKNNKISVFVADDHPIVRQGIVQALSNSSDIEIVGEAENGNEVLEKVKQIKVDVLVMDFDMPEKNGFDTLLQLKDTFPDLPVIILSVFSEVHYGIRFLKAGASGYLEKTCVPNQLVQAIKKVHSGGSYVSSNLADMLVLGLNENSGKPLHQILSKREFQIFYMIASGKKLKAIADELFLSINTVSTHRARILEKLNMKSNTDIVRYAIENKIVS